MIQFPEIDETKLSALIQLIEEINQLNNPEELEKQLQTLTGKADIRFQEVLNYWEKKMILFS